MRYSFEVSRIASMPASARYVPACRPQTPYGTMIKASKLRLYVSAAVPYGKPAYFEAAVERCVVHTIWGVGRGCSKRPEITATRGNPVFQTAVRLVPGPPLAAMKTMCDANAVREHLHLCWPAERRVHGRVRQR